MSLGIKNGTVNLADTGRMVGVGAHQIPYSEEMNKKQRRRRLA
jgi:hypothetical protein